jgi:urea transport system substrate-binding protein
MNNVIKNRISYSIVILFIVITALVLENYFYKPVIKIGVMHSLTGTMANSEKNVVDAILLAVEEINQSGGLLGRNIEAVVKDGKSNPKEFARITEILIVDDKVDVIFGCWTSNCRKSVLPIFEKYNHLLYYPLQYEGLESSKNIIYLGTVPNQQVIPALEWVFSEIGKKVYLVGSDYIYPHATNEIIRNQTEKWRGEIVGEKYRPLGDRNFTQIIEEISELKPDVIFSTINGSSNLSFFKALRAKNISAQEIPTFSFSISEDELTNFGEVEMTGDYLVWNYLEGLNNKLNQEFRSRFKARYGKKRSIGDPMVTAYMGVKLWAKSVLKSGSSDVSKVRETASDLSINGPGGMLYIEKHSQHTWKPIHIAKITENRRLTSVWFSKIPIAPTPFPDYRTRSQWANYINHLKSTINAQ